MKDLIERRNNVNIEETEQYQKPLSSDNPSIW